MFQICARLWTNEKLFRSNQSGISYAKFRRAEHHCIVKKCSIEMYRPLKWFISTEQRFYYYFIVSYRLLAGSFN